MLRNLLLLLCALAAASAVIVCPPAPAETIECYSGPAIEGGGFSATSYASEGSVCIVSRVKCLSEPCYKKLELGKEHAFAFATGRPGTARSCESIAELYSNVTVGDTSVNVTACNTNLCNF